MTALILALVTLLSVPVSADEYDSRWVSFLDYDTGGVNGNYLTLTSEARLDYTLPFVVGARSFQGLFMYNGRQPSSVYVLREGSTNRYPCTVLNLGNGLCRFYLTSEANQLNDDGFSLLFVGEGTSTVINLLEFDYSEVRSTMFAETGSMDVNGAVYTMSSSTSSVSHTYSTASGSTLVKFYSSNWKYYDYLSFFVYQTGIEIQSLTARFGTFPVPVSVDYLNSGDSHAIDPRTSCMITIDLRGINRNKTDIPILELSGYRSTSDVNASITLLGVTGIVEISETDPLYNFLGLFVNGFSDSNELLAHIYDQNVVDHEAILGWFSEINFSLSGFRDSVDSWLSSISDKLDQLIGGTSEGDSLSDGSQELESQAADIHDYEQSQQEVLDNNFDTIQDSVSVGRFSAAFLFVQRYINMSWLSIADFSIIYTLPFFIGIFFFICGRLPGATRPKYRPPNYRGGRSNNRGGGPK